MVGVPDLGLIREFHGNYYRGYRDYIGIIGLQRGYIGIMEKSMEITIVHWGYTGINGKENGNYYSISVATLLCLLNEGLSFMQGYGPNQNA